MQYDYTGINIDVATCGKITPLSTLDYLIGSFDSDIITMDYRVRGFTRDVDGKKYFLDHAITSIQDYINPQIMKNERTILQTRPQMESAIHIYTMLGYEQIDNYPPYDKLDGAICLAKKLKTFILWRKIWDLYRLTKTITAKR